MEADWSVEIGFGLPRIDGGWDGWVDLRADQLAIKNVKEAVEHSVMQDALLALNGAHSPVLTTKCDVWRLGGQEIDPYEFGASSEAVFAGFASYIDIFLVDSARFASFAFHEDWARRLALHLRSIELPHGRVDLVLRAAVLKEQQGCGLTAYSAGCGASEAEAYTSWQAMLSATVAATIAAARASSSIG